LLLEVGWGGAKPYNDFVAGHPSAVSPIKLQRFSCTATSAVLTDGHFVIFVEHDVVRRQVTVYDSFVLVQIAQRKNNLQHIDHHDNTHTHTLSLSLSLSLSSSSRLWLLIVK